MPASRCNWASRARGSSSATTSQARQVRCWSSSSHRATVSNLLRTHRRDQCARQVGAHRLPTRAPGTEGECWNDQGTVPSAARPLLAVGAALVLLLIGVGPAAAHVKATVDPGAQAGTGPVTVAFSVEAGSPSAGIASIRAQVPEGIPPESVSLASGPAGWA